MQLSNYVYIYEKTQNKITLRIDINLTPNSTLNQLLIFFRYFPYKIFLFTLMASQVKTQQ